MNITQWHHCYYCFNLLLFSLPLSLCIIVFTPIKYFEIELLKCKHSYFRSISILLCWSSCSKGLYPTLQQRPKKRWRPDLGNDCLYPEWRVWEHFTSVLMIWNHTSHTVVKVGPETSNYILASISRKGVGNIRVWRLVECEVSIIINLKHKTFCQYYSHRFYWSQMSL